MGAALVFGMASLNKLSLNILEARRERDNAVTPEAFRIANIRVAAAFEAWRAIARRNTL
jgi:hypothetical protein